MTTFQQTWCKLSRTTLRSSYRVGTKPKNQFSLELKETVVQPMKQILFNQFSKNEGEKSAILASKRGASAKYFHETSKC